MKTQLKLLIAAATQRSKKKVCEKQTIFVYPEFTVRVWADGRVTCKGVNVTRSLRWAFLEKAKGQKNWLRPYLRLFAKQAKNGDWVYSYARPLARFGNNAEYVTIYQTGYMTHTTQRHYAEMMALLNEFVL